MKTIEDYFESESLGKNELKISGFLRMLQATGGGCAVPNSQEEASLHASFNISTIYIFSCVASYSYYLFALIREITYFYYFMLPHLNAEKAI